MGRGKPHSPKARLTMCNRGAAAAAISSHLLPTWGGFLAWLRQESYYEALRSFRPVVSPQLCEYSEERVPFKLGNRLQWFSLDDFCSNIAQLIGRKSRSFLQDGAVWQYPSFGLKIALQPIKKAAGLFESKSSWSQWQAGPPDFKKSDTSPTPIHSPRRPPAMLQDGRHRVSQFSGKCLPARCGTR